MFPLHCNKCFRQRETEPHTLNFLISECQHILCANCLSPTCPNCQKEYRGVIINNNMPPEYSVYFSEPEKHFRRFQNICKFQAEQRALLFSHFVFGRAQERAELERKIKSYKKIQTKLSNSIQHEQERCTKLNAYLDWHKRHAGENGCLSRNSSRPNTPMTTFQISSDDDEDSGIQSKSSNTLSFIGGRI